MRKKTLTGRILMGLGLILLFWGLVMLNVISDIGVFENMDKSVGGSVLILGIVSLITSNFFRENNTTH
ncbi:hypothetical protein [Bacillus sp. XF8]|uniref:hypothetical protein n=1 Tax=Bacillus sp. XF8 TaxID=2819289 RepID=UPI001AA028A0|nr:hypothetical protein [Bacillus sp. XF8]MBO1579081.1 hypothetical protein [Bacillus sp. XF8]